VEKTEDALFHINGSVAESLSKSPTLMTKKNVEN